MIFLISGSLGESARLLLAQRVGARLGEAIPVQVGPVEPQDLGGLVWEEDKDGAPWSGAARAAWWGEADAAGGREARPCSEIPEGGLLLPGEPDRPAAKLDAEAEDLAAKLDARPELAAKLEAKRAAKAGR